MSRPARQEEVRLLADMFPDACRLELLHCLSLAGGCLEKAAQLLLARQESGDAITQQQQVSRYTQAILGSGRL